MTNEPRRSTRQQARTSQDLTRTASDVTNSLTERDTSSIVADRKDYSSSIAKHLSENVDCVKVYSDACFEVLTRGRSRRHLEVLESVYIHTQQPNLCTQKKYIAPLHLFKSQLSPTNKS